MDFGFVGGGILHSPFSFNFQMLQPINLIKEIKTLFIAKVRVQLPFFTNLLKIQHKN